MAQATQGEEARRKKRCDPFGMFPDLSALIPKIGMDFADFAVPFGGVGMPVFDGATFGSTAIADVSRLPRAGFYSRKRLSGLKDAFSGWARTRMQ